MIRTSEFFTEEKDAPLLILNRGYLEKNTDELVQLVKTWPVTAGAPAANAHHTLPNNLDRIFEADAKRTYCTEPHRQDFVKLLAFLKEDFKDYAQGLGYVASFFLLTMEKPEVVNLLAHMNSQDKYMRGYWKHEAVEFVNDAYVFQELLIRTQPDIAAHLQKYGVDASTYCQKWFVGLCVHVLPMEHLFQYFTKFMEQGRPFLFKFGLSLIRQLNAEILASKSTEQLFGILRLDPNFVKLQDPLLSNILNHTSDFDMTQYNFAEERKLAFDKYLAKRLAPKPPVDPSDEIEDCEICLDEFPDVVCRKCRIKICDKCHQDPPRGHQHINTHKVTNVGSDDESDDKSGDEDEVEDSHSEDKSAEVDSLTQGLKKQDISKN